jgi:DNA polymerase-3 subunit delta
VARLEDFLRAWPQEVRMLLLHGYDAAGVQDNANRVCRALVDPANPAGLERLTGDQLVSDRQALVAALSSMSMFGGQAIVRVDGADDKAVPALAAALEAPGGNPLIVVAGGLKKNSALLALAARTSGVAVIESRSLSPAQMGGVVREMASELGLRCDQDAALALVDATAGDRILIRAELEKLALYLDASPERPCAADLAAVTAISAGINEFDHAALVMAALGGQSAALVSGLTDMPSGEGVVALRILGSRLATLAEMRARMDNGVGPEAAVDAARPPVFWKEKLLWVAALRRWTSRGLAPALRAVLTAETALKSRGGLGDLEAQALLLRVARAR